MAGHTETMRPENPAIAAEPFARRPDGKVHFVRVVAERDRDGVLHVRSAGGQGSHHLTAMARADALLPLVDGEGVRGRRTGREILLLPSSDMAPLFGALGFGDPGVTSVLLRLAAAQPGQS